MDDVVVVASIRDLRVSLFRDDDEIPLCWMMIMMRLFVCTCYDYICGLADICMCIMMTFLCAKDSSIKLVQIQKNMPKK